MALAVVTGSGGLVGSEAARVLVERGYEVIGVEKDMRARFFGRGGSTASVTRSLEQRLEGFRRVKLDISDREGVDRLVERDAEWTVRDAPRVGDHRWWITDLGEFRRDNPGWSVTVSLDQLCVASAIATSRAG